MKIVVLAPDKFKGSLPATGVCDAMAVGLRRVWPDVIVRTCPMADGGDGTLDAILAHGGSRETIEATGADGTPHRVPFGIVPDPQGRIGVIEVASVVGLVDAQGTRVDVGGRTTRGIGEVMRALLDRGVHRFMIGLGGSSTNDGGAGLLAGLGVTLLDHAGHAVPATPAGLARLARVEGATLDARVRDAEITILSDVDNPLCGERGATAVFGPQKGVSASDVQRVDGVLARYALLAESALGVQAAHEPGAGAAGGLGFALQLLGGRARTGAEVVADLAGLDEALAGASWMITGEGRSDRQTLAGKAPWVALRRATAAGIPATLISGALERQALPELSRAFAGCFALPDAPLTLADCLRDAAVLVADRTEQAARLVERSRSP